MIILMLFLRDHAVNLVGLSTLLNANNYNQRGSVQEHGAIFNIMTGSVKLLPLQMTKSGANSLLDKYDPNLSFTNQSFVVTYYPLHC